jgi:SAM-dependent methyltransferase
MNLEQIKAEASGARTLELNVLSDVERIGIKRELYNSYADSYDARTLSGFSLYKREYDLFASRMIGKKVLDLGCGPGRDAVELTRRGLSVFGVDLAQHALRKAQARGIETMCLNYEADLWKLYGKSFDGLWTNCSLTTTPRYKIKGMLGELSALLPCGAPAFFGFIEGNPSEGWMVPDWKYELPRFRFRDTREGICSLLSSNGFEPVYVNILPKEVSGKNTYVNVHCVRSYGLCSK